MAPAVRPLTTAAPVTMMEAVPGHSELAAPTTEAQGSVTEPTPVPVPVLMAVPALVMVPASGGADLTGARAATTIVMEAKRTGATLTTLGRRGEATPHTAAVAARACGGDPRA